MTRIEKTPSRPSISGTLSAATRRQWAQFCLSRHRGWQLSIHEPWLDAGISRVVLIQSVFMLNFEFKTGDEAARQAAQEEAIAYANANPYRRGTLGDYDYFAFPGAVAFTATLKAAGWVTGSVAARLNALIDAQDAKTFERVLSSITSYLPDDYTELVADALQAEAR